MPTEIAIDAPYDRQLQTHTPPPDIRRAQSMAWRRSFRFPPATRAVPSTFSVSRLGQWQALKGVAQGSELGISLAWLGFYFSSWNARHPGHQI
ncbi:hypothetical protein GCM10010394_46960 [Streptomyces crystallinus]|uniref:Uncharacterized protein n=1 Tax=Streptomyces crystallinus TaxID=68191 RepID=A0ABP3RJH5_9ACTN